MPWVSLTGHLPMHPLPRLNPAPSDRQVELDIVLRHHGRDLPSGAVAALMRHCRASGLRAPQLDAEAGVLETGGSVEAVASAFLVRLLADEAGGLWLPEEPKLPRALAAEVAAVVGLGWERPRRRGPHPRGPRHPLAEQAFAGYRPGDIARAYGYDGLPPAGAKRRAVLLEFSSGYRQGDLDLFCHEMGLPRLVPTVLRVDRGLVGPGDQPQDLEATLDLEWLWAAAQGGRVYFVEAPSGSTDAAFAVHVVDAVRKALSLKPDVVSISYGDGELLLPPAVLRATDLLLQRLSAAGADTFVASGDQGAAGVTSQVQPGLAQVDYPACCPHAIAVGGTHLVLGASGLLETGWTDTDQNGASGGGFSAVFSATPGQDAFLPAGQTARGVPDIALDADPLTGYQVVFNAEITVVGGTSVAAPVAAGASLRLREALGGGPTLWSQIYALPMDAFRDILSGENDFGGVRGYRCGAGWDPVTGRGAPLFAEILKALGG